MSKISRRHIIGGAAAGTIAAGTGIKAVQAKPARGRLRADVCVVGAGYAGLAAAYRLKQAGLNVIVLEARLRVGGRSWSVRMKDGTFVDFGGQWVGGTQDRFYALIKEMGGETYAPPDDDLRTLQRGIINTDEYHRVRDGTDSNFPGGDTYFKVSVRPVKARKPRNVTVNSLPPAPVRCVVTRMWTSATCRSRDSNEQYRVTSSVEPSANFASTRSR